jgi:hypothetical protein
MRSWPFYLKTEVVLGYLYTILHFVVYCSFAYVKKIYHNWIPPHSVEVKGKKRFSGFTSLEPDVFLVLILSKTAQAYSCILKIQFIFKCLYTPMGSV